MSITRAFALGFCVSILAFSLCFADEGTLLLTTDYCGGYGIALLPNDVNDDLLLLYVTTTYENNQYPVAYDLHIALLRRGAGGAYGLVSDTSIFHSTFQIPQVTWAYDTETDRFLIAFLSDEVYVDGRLIKFVALDISGTVIGQVQTLKGAGNLFHYPAVCAIPSKMANKPALANFLFAARAYNPSTQESGIVTQFVRNTGVQTGALKWALKEVSSPAGKPTYHPYILVPRADNKGYLLACEWDNPATNILQPTLIGISGAGDFQKRLALSQVEMRYESLSIQPVAKKKYAVAWVDSETRRFWSTIAPATLSRAAALKLVSENPACPGDFDRPYPLLVKRATNAGVDIFCVGDRPDQSVYQAAMLKSGTTSGLHQVTVWEGVGLEIQYAFEHWFAVAPIAGTADYYCAVVFRTDENLVIRGFTIPDQ